MALSVISSVLITFIFVLISIIVLKLSAAWRHVRTLGKAIDQLPGEQIHWLWGTLNKFPGANEKGLAYGLQMTAKYGRLHRYWRTRFFPGLALYHPQTTSPIFHTAEPKPTSFGAYGLGRDWIGDGLLLSAGKKWARNRRLLTPAFHFDILKPYIKVKNDATEPLLAKMKQHAERGTPMEMFSAVSLYTFDVILRCSMSYQDDVQLQGESHPYVQAVCELGELWTARFLKPWLYNDFIYSFTAEGKKWRKCSDYVHSMSEQIITKRMEALKSSNGAEEQRRYKDFLDVLLTARDDDGKGLSFREIRDEVDTFLFEGHDTTASGISWTLYSLAQSADCQRKCQDEVDEVLHGRDSDELSWEDLNQLKYTTMVVKEALRLHCPVPMIQRELTKDMTISGVTLPPGCHVDIAIYNLHHNPLVWTDPMTFNPDRFLPENFDKMDSFAYVPFSAGPRNCIGQHFAMHEMKIAVARLMRRYSLTLDETCTVRKKPTLVMRTENGIRMYVTARDV